MNDTNNDYNSIFWTHRLVILLWYVSPLFFTWYWLLLGTAFSYLQGILIGGCILSHKQFGEEADETFFRYYLNKLGFNMSKKMAKIIFFWLEPIIIPVIAFVIQIVWHYKPIFF
jgi:hypothetical protein